MFRDADGLQLEDAQGKLYEPKDFFRDVQRLMYTFFHLVQTTSPQLVNTPKKQKKPKLPFNHKLIVDRLGFGNLTLNLAFTFNFMSTNTFNG